MKRPIQGTQKFSLQVRDLMKDFKDRLTDQLVGTEAEFFEPFPFRERKYPVPIQSEEDDRGTGQEGLEAKVITERS